MAKLGVITDGISRDLEHALQVATEHDLEYAELQFVWDKEAGDLDDDQMAKALALVDKYGVKVSSITRHNFVGLLVGEVEVGDAVHQKHMDGRCRVRPQQAGYIVAFQHTLDDMGFRFARRPIHHDHFRQLVFIRFTQT